MLAAEAHFRCRWAAGDLGRETEVDAVVIDFQKQRIDFLVTKDRDGWTFSNRGRFGRGKTRLIYAGPHRGGLRQQLFEQTF